MDKIIDFNEFKNRKLKKRNLIYTGLLMLSMLTTPVYAADKNINVMNGVG